MHVVTIVNQKGGVGKSMTSANLGSALSRTGLRVLAIDLDPQGTLTRGTLGDRSGQGTAEALGYGISASEEPPSIASFATPIAAFGFDLLASNVDRLTSCDESLRANSARQMLLTQQLADVEDAYDVVVLDSPPSLGALTMTGIYASDSVLVPVDASAESLDGLGLLKVTLQRTRAIKRDLKIMGAVVTKFNARATVDTGVLHVMEADSAFPFVATIRLTNQAKTAFMERRPLTPPAPIGEDYAALAEAVRGAIA